MIRPCIAHICLFPGSGGAEHYLLNVARGLAVDWPLLVVTIQDSWLEEQARAAGLDVAVLPDPGGNSSAATVLRLARLLRQRGVRITHSHLGRSDWYTWLAAKLAGGVILVSTEHGISAGRPDLFVQNTAAQRWHEWGHRLRLRDTDAVVAISLYTARALRGRYGGSSVPLALVRSGIDLSRFPSRALTPDPDDGRPLRLVYVGRLEAEKGPDLLLEAARQCGDQGVPLEVTMVGDGSLRANLQAQWVPHPRVDVRWAGQVHDTAGYLAEGDVFVLPSRSENLPLALLEAMAAGLPVVATRVGGVAEVVEDGRTGLLVEPEDAVSLAGAIEWCYGHRAAAVGMGSAGRRLVQRFELKRMVRALSILYEELVRVRASRSVREPAG